MAQLPRLSARWLPAAGRPDLSADGRRDFYRRRTAIGGVGAYRLAACLRGDNLLLTITRHAQWLRRLWVQSSTTSVRIGRWTLSACSPAPVAVY